jgi:ABC-type Co2+ transport system permease subunit
MENRVMPGYQRPELRVRVGPIEIDAKGLAAIRAARIPLAVTVGTLSAFVLASVFIAFELGLAEKAIELSKLVVASSRMDERNLTPIIFGIGTVSTIAATIFGIRRLRRSKSNKMVDIP